MLTVIGCGNSNRCDDGVGVFVAQSLQRRLAERPRANVRVFDAGTGGMEVMFQARGARKLVIVDAARSNSAAGAIFRVPGAELAAEHEPAFTLHDFRWDHALAAGRRIFGDAFPADITVYLIEALSVDFGLALSAPVRKSADTVVAEIERVIDEYGAAELVAPDGEPAPRAVSVGRGNIYLSRELCARYFAGADAVAVLARAGEMLIMPLARGAAGGTLLKVRNSRGDRVVHAQEFFRAHGYAEDACTHEVDAEWHEAEGALVVRGLPAPALQT